MTTTPQDLLIVALDAESGHPPEQGELSLALAGAELIDLLGAQAVRLDDDDHIVPGYRPTITDRLLDQAASSLVRQAPYESVDEWLWRRGRGLAAAYLDALAAEGQPSRQRRHRMPFRAGQGVPADAPAHRAAADRWTSRDPVLTALAAAAGIDDTRTGDSPDVTDDAAATVLAAVNDAVRELDAVRRRRAIEDAAFDNIWRGGVG
ncbi:GPP34 family phosphoprotein [Kitasatospora sp. NPDC050543]|uniref:GPP34 family phosphoprotein n=1 Tax=Kitasatospora sp. NPDC050543 TaxID=3364054 RepID=UPI0037AFBD10